MVGLLSFLMAMTSHQTRGHLREGLFQLTVRGETAHHDGKVLGERTLGKLVTLHPQSGRREK